MLCVVVGVVIVQSIKSSLKNASTISLRRATISKHLESGNTRERPKQLKVKGSLSGPANSVMANDIEFANVEQLKDEFKPSELTKTELIPS